MNYLRFQSRQFYRYIMNRLMSKLDEEDLERTATVFSPHPDDETLGCGGTILKKKRAGAEVKIFFMTAGEKSHSHLISEDELKRIRTNEALGACRMLGLNADDVAFLGYKDCELSRNMDSAVEKVRKILLVQEPDDVFIPHRSEPIVADHSATNRIVLAALRMCKRNVVVYEYPVWLWYHLPWVGLPSCSAIDILSAFKRSLYSGSSLLRDFRSSVYIGDVLQLKRVALDQHKSQMTALSGDSRWPTLGDLSNGEFLECFFQEYEIFHQYVLYG